VSTRIARAVLFDLDGTLVDTAPDLCAAANAMRAQHVLEPLPVETLKPAASRGTRAMLALALPQLDAEAREAWVEPFLQAYAGAIAVHSRLFEGMHSVLDAIEADGATWGIVTNKPYYLARALIDTLDLGARCAVLIGGDTLAQRKPDPQPLWFACDQIGLSARSAVYVGDDQRDVQAAHAAGMRCIAAAWGYRDGKDCIEAWQADAIAMMPRDLLAPDMLSAAPSRD
jgi:2-phosphoglycolate phosphatase